MIASLVFTTLVAAQSPGPGREIEIQALGSAWVKCKLEGLNSNTPNGATGTRWLSYDGGDSWFEDGTWKKDGENILNFAGEILMEEVTGAGDFDRSEGDIISRYGPDEGDDIGGWRTPGS